MTHPPVIATLIDLLETPSLTLEEDVICSKVQSHIAKLARPLVAHRLRNNLIISGPRLDGRPTLALVGHFDTVPGVVARARCEEDRIHGLGASDMKAGLAVMLETIVRAPLDTGPFNLCFVFYEAEEGLYTNNGLHLVFREFREILQRIDLAIVLEPTNLTFQVGALGSLHGQVQFHGKRAHSARPWEGRNAIFECVSFLNYLKGLAPREFSFGTVKYSEVFTPTSIRSGDNANNVVPDEVRIGLNYRFRPGMTVDEACQAFAEMIPQGATFEIHDRSPSAIPPMDNPLFLRIAEQWGVPVQPKQAFTDVATFAEHGIAAVNFGPGLTAQAHQKDEYVKVPDVLQCLNLFQSLLGW